MKIDKRVIPIQIRLSKVPVGGVFKYTNDKNPNMRIERFSNQENGMILFIDLGTGEVCEGENDDLAQHFPDAIVSLHSHLINKDP